MKLTFLPAFAWLLLIFSTNANAQTKKGAIFLGGSLGHSNREDENNAQELRSTTISPVVGLAVRNDLIVGINFSYVRQESENETSNVQNEGQYYGGSIFVRSFFLGAAKK